VPYSERDNAPRTGAVLRNLGRRVTHLRLALGISQRSLAAMTGIDQSVISRFENGRAAGMRVDKLAAILAALGVDRLDRLQPSVVTRSATDLKAADAPWGIESDG
jgi:transcriptional regulator with XRE-family HTH domain